MHLKTALLKLWFSKCKVLFRKLYLIRWPEEMQSWLDTLSLYQFFSCMFVLIMTVQNFCLGAMKEFFLHNRGLEERFFQICWWEKNKKGICCNVITFFLCVMASVWSEKTVSTVGSQFCLSRLNHNAEQRTMCCHICSLFSAATLLLQTTINHILM